MPENEPHVVARWAGLACLIAAILFVSLGNGSGGQGRPAVGATIGPGLIIDDFSSDQRTSALGTKWVLRNDRAAGKPTGVMYFTTSDQRNCLYLSNGAEARLNLHPLARPFDARVFEGLQVKVRGAGGPYAVRLRTHEIPLASGHYEARFDVNETWRDLRLPFRSFIPVGLRKPLDVAMLRAVGIAALDKMPNTGIYLAEIAFYSERPMYNPLTPEEQRVIIHKGTEAPFSGQYNNFFEVGVYTCKRCDANLFESSTKFRSECGWPSFDDQIPGAVRWVPDADGVRTEILCANCGAHLGHVFRGEKRTPKDTRYCVNSISMSFIPASDPRSATPNPQSLERAIFASGCFWGTEYYLQRVAGVIATTVGYTGGQVNNPTYQQVSTGRTGHAEAVEVLFDPTRTSYERLAKLFFETHDFTQINRQGPDVGTQYRSAIFYLNDQQKQVATRMVETLRKAGYKVATQIVPAGAFWPAEDYHQDYYKKTSGVPYCHVYRPIPALESATTR